MHLKNSVDSLCSISILLPAAVFVLPAGILYLVPLVVRFARRSQQVINSLICQLIVNRHSKHESFKMYAIIPGIYYDRIYIPGPASMIGGMGMRMQVFVNL